MSMPARGAGVVLTRQGHMASERGTHEGKVIMARSLQDKLATLDPTRRARIEAEADRLREEYLDMQQSPERQDDKRNDTDSDHR
jgi:hypothetical protein